MRFLMRATLSILAFSLVACTGPVGITREGYEPPTDEALNQACDCKIALKNNASFAENDVEVLGAVKFYDTGFSVVCDEEYVLSLASLEACTLGADLVNIIEDKQPDHWSTCYRAKADFLLLENRDEATALTSDNRYDWRLVQERARSGRQATEHAVVFGSFVTFAVIGAAIGSTVEATPPQVCAKEELQEGK